MQKASRQGIGQIGMRDPAWSLEGMRESFPVRKVSPLFSASLPFSAQQDLRVWPFLPQAHPSRHAPSAGLRGPGVDPDRLVAGAPAIDPGMGDVRVCVLLRGHHDPAHPVYNWCPRRGGFLDHPGESQLGMSEGVGSVGPFSSEGWLFPCWPRLPRRRLPPVF